MTAQVQTMLRVPRGDAAQKLENQISKGNELLSRTIASNAEMDLFLRDKQVWSDYNAELLRSLFTTNDMRAEYISVELAQESSVFDDQIDAAIDDVKEKIRCLHSIVQRLELIPEDIILGDRTTGASGLRTGPFNRRVFIVHGHHEGKREAVARLLEQLDMEPIILHEQPSKGQTLIEKIEHNSDVGFAVVLLTGDDLGCMKGETDNLKPRARQNVVFELGYFFGLLGRKRVCALYESGVELPSDIQGLVYVQLDDPGHWKTSLVQELRAAGFDIDLTKLIA